MRKNIIAAIACALATISAALCPDAAHARRGEASVGVVGGYTTKNDSPLAGIFFQYSFSDHFRIAPDLGCVFRNKGLDNLFFDANVHFPFAIAGRTELYPLAGFSYTSWDRHYISDADLDDVSTRVGRVGLNLGAGIDVRATRTLRLRFEAVYTLNDGYSTFSPVIGIGYTF